MLLSPIGTLHDFIVETLFSQPMTADEILAQHNATSESVSIQAVYKALRKLVSAGVVLKHKETYSLNNVWRSRLTSLLSNKDSSAQLQEGESIVYSFKSLEQLDMYWKHIQEGITQDSQVTYFFCPHQYWWFVPGRRESEIDFYNQFDYKKKFAVLLLGGNTAIDKELKKIITNKHVRVHAEKEHSLRMTDNLTIRDDFIVRTRLPYNTSNRINSIFEQHLSMQETENQLQELFSKKIPVKIYIERNKAKAKRLSRQIGKYFYIPVEPRDS